MKVFSTPTPTLGNNILDLAFPNNFDFTFTCKVGEPLANSDHEITDFSNPQPRLYFIIQRFT